MLKNGNYQLGDTLTNVTDEWGDKERIALMKKYPVLKNKKFQGDGQPYEMKKNDKSKQGGDNGDKAKPKQASGSTKSSGKPKS